MEAHVHNWYDVTSAREWLQTGKSTRICTEIGCGVIERYDDPNRTPSAADALVLARIKGNLEKAR